MSDWDKLMDPAREALEALVAKGDEMADRIEELEAKLAKAVEALEHAKLNMPHPDQMIDDTLAELKEEDRG